MLRRKIPFAACDAEAGRSRCWGEKNHLKTFLKWEGERRRGYRINLLDLIRYVTEEEQKVKQPLKRGAYRAVNAED